MKFKIFPGNSVLQPGLRTKFGIDPTLDRLHLGHLVPLRLVRKLQERGNQVTIVLGTFTATLGDPSGRDCTRPFLDESKVKSNADKILAQLNNLLLPFSVVENNEFFKFLSINEFLRKVSSITVSNVLSRDSFQKRISEGNSIAIHELLVPLFQALDSVFLKTELEIGGQDQLFNFSLTRQLQANLGVPPQICLMTPIIRGTDGRKMSKSFFNCIFIDESAETIFAKIMSISDDVMQEWFPLLTDNFLITNQPLESKKLLAFDIVKQLHGEEKAIFAKNLFEEVIQNKKTPSDIQSIQASVIIEAIMKIRNCSKSEAIRLLSQGAVRLNGKQITENHQVFTNDLIKVGKLHWGKIN